MSKIEPNYEYERVTKSVLEIMKETGKIADFQHSRPNGPTDKEGIDFIVTRNDGTFVELQVKPQDARGIPGFNEKKRLGKIKDSVKLLTVPKERFSYHHFYNKVMAYILDNKVDYNLWNSTYFKVLNLVRKQQVLRFSYIGNNQWRIILPNEKTSTITVSNIRELRAVKASNLKLKFRS